MRALLVVLVGLGLIGCVEGRFHCGDDQDCGSGICEPNGFCSFQDDECASGRRFGELATEDAAGRCVEEGSEQETQDRECSVTASTGACPSQCQGSCEEGVCVVACSGPGACSDTTIACPPGWPCEVACSGVAACTRLDVQCADAGCGLACTGLGSCHEARVGCGGGPCDVSCAGVHAGTLEIDCGSACACDRSCAI